MTYDESDDPRPAIGFVLTLVLSVIVCYLISLRGCN